jgi:hypothetical protein
MAGLQGVGPGAIIGYAENFDLVKMGTSSLKTIGITFKKSPDARLPIFQNIAAGTDAFLPLSVACTRRHNG